MLQTMLLLAWLATASALVAPQYTKPPTTRLRAAAPLVELYGERVSAGDETLIDTLSLKVDKGDRVALVGCALRKLCDDGVIFRGHDNTSVEPLAGQ